MSEIAYSIQPQQTLNEGFLVLDLMEVHKNGYAFSFPAAQEGKAISRWRSLASSTLDQEAFNFLLKEERLFQQKKTGKLFPQIDSLIVKQLHISPHHAEEAFKSLAPTQKLFCKGKQLIIDLYGRGELYYSGALSQNGELSIEGRLRWRDFDVALSECEAIGQGRPLHWFVRGLTVKFIGNHVGWKQLQRLREGPLHLEGGLKQTFLDELDPSDPEVPVLIMKEGSAEKLAEQCSPYPVLKLIDRWGACANLSMDYGHGHLVPFEDSQTLIKSASGDAGFKRQLDNEAIWEKDLLETGYIKKIVGSSHYYCPLDAVAKTLAFLIELGWKVVDVNNRQVLNQTGVELEFQDENQMITIKGRVRYDDYEADLSQITGAFNKQEHFVQLSPTTVGLLSLDATQHALRDLAEEGEIIGSGVWIKKARFGALAPLWESATVPQSLCDLKEKLEHFKGIEEALPSPSFKGSLRPYQQEGLNWMGFLQEYGFHGLLADEMGLGKTVQVLAFLSRLPRDKPHLIVMPTSLLFNWRNEIHQFLPEWSCIIHQGGEREREAKELEKNHIILTSYTTLRLDLPLLKSISWKSLILDEAQTIKNSTTQTAQAACQLEASLRLSLTGTPVENHLSELWSHFRFLIPELLGSKDQFEADVQAIQADHRYLDKIKRKTNPFILRRRKQDVASDLPPRLEQTVWLEMHPGQKSAYDQLLTGFKSGLLKKVESEGMGKHRLEVLEAILRLRQVCCHPLLVSHLAADEIASSAKFDFLLQDLETIIDEGHKVLVYSQFTSMLQLMSQAAKEKAWSYGYLDGSTKNREAAVTRFQDDPDQLLFFISLKAGGVGLNLTAADYVYLYDPWWNVAVEEQAINRAHRIGRKEAVIAKRLIISDSIEEKIMKLKAAKKLIADDLFEGETNLSQFTFDDLKFLIE